MNRLLSTVALSLLGLGNTFSQIGGANGTGQWSAPIQFPLIPVSVANLPNGKVLVWSAEHTHSFGAVVDEHTETALFDPVTKTITQNTAGHAHHDMFCTGINNLADGRILVTGGLSTKSTSIYNPVNNTWSAAADMNFGRGYQGAVTMSTGVPFLIGGSWSGGLGGKLAEVYSPTNGWSVLPNMSVPLTIMDGATDPEGQYRNDNHAWMFAAPNGKIFHAGPSTNMHWMDLSNGGTGSLVKARGNDDFAMQGICVMYEKGKLLKVGGSTSYSTKTLSSAKTFTIDINDANNVIVTDVLDIKRPRIFHNSVILPNGEVFVVGGMDHAEPFKDNGSVLIPEIWNPNSKTWRDVKAMVAPRNYHSVALLLPDGTVFVGGGGLCVDCATNHADAEIFSPSYLFNTNNTIATRPVISSVPAATANNTTVQVTTTGSVSYFSLIRMSSNTHSTNNEQRYRRVPFSTVGTNTYKLTIEDANTLVPGYYMLFAVNANGTPSLSKSIKIGTETSICTIKPSYTIDGVTKSGQVALGVASGKTMVLSVLPKNIPFTIQKPDGSKVTSDLNLGVLNTGQSGKYTLAFAGCTTKLDLTVTNCNATSILPEFNLNDTWTTGVPNQTVNVERGKQMSFSAMPNEVAVASVTLPDGREVIDGFIINPMLASHSGVYKMLSSLGCETNLNVIVPCSITPRYSIKGVWTNIIKDQATTVEPGTSLVLGIAETAYPVTIKLPNGKLVPDGYNITAASRADTGTYTFITNEGCFSYLKLKLGTCPASKIIPEYFVDDAWNAGTQNQELVVTTGKSITISMLPNIAAPLTITKPDGTIYVGDLSLQNLTAQNSGTYTLSSDGCNTTLKLKVNNCTLPLLPEYNINNTWFNTTTDQMLTLAPGQPLVLSILPAGPALTLTKPDGTIANDDLYIPSVSTANAGIYTFTSSDGCVARLNVSVGKCPSMAVIPHYNINGTWSSANSGSTISVAKGASFTLSMLPKNIAATIRKPDGSEVGANLVLSNYNSTFNGVYTIISDQGCSATLSVATVSPRIASESVLAEEPADLDASQALNIFPNPFVDQLDLTWNENQKFTKLLLLDFSGKVLLSQDLNNEQTSAHVSLEPLKLKEGAYLIRMEGSEKKGISRILYKK